MLEDYLADLHSAMSGRTGHRAHVSVIGLFLTAVRQHGWAPGLPPDARLFPGDQPPRIEFLPRALAGHVMAQVEQPGNLARQANPAYRLATVILIRCGLRISDALKLPFGCTVTDDSGAPYLRYFNHKMKREALVPVDDELLELIRGQQQRILDRYPAGIVLFPRPAKNPDGKIPVGGATYRPALYRWLQRCDIRDEHGRRAPHSPPIASHLGTTLINRDVPQHVVQKILDHDSPLMTAHYARLSDRTVREHWEKARKVSAEGRPVEIRADGPLGDAAWSKQRLSRATQSLPNGYCELPMAKTCPHANSCLTCPMFVTTAEFLPQHHAQRKHTLQIITAAEAAGHARVAEMNKQVAANLDKIIATLEDGGKRTRRQPPVNPDPLAQAAARRHELTRARAVEALRELDRSGAPVTFAGVAHRRDLTIVALYPARQSAARSAGSGKRRTTPAPPAPSPPASGPPTASLRARLTTALDRNKQLADENARLRRQLARALGDQRSAQTRSGNDQGG